MKNKSAAHQWPHKVLDRSHKSFNSSQGVQTKFPCIMNHFVPLTVLPIFSFTNFPKFRDNSQCWLQCLTGLLIKLVTVLRRYFRPYSINTKKSGSACRYFVYMLNENVSYHKIENGQKINFVGFASDRFSFSKSFLLHNMYPPLNHSSSLTAVILILSSAFYRGKTV